MALFPKTLTGEAGYDKALGSAQSLINQTDETLNVISQEQTDHNSAIALLYQQIADHNRAIEDGAAKAKKLQEMRAALQVHLELQ